MRAHERRTKIVATIGPASSSRGVIDALMGAGIDAARLNMSHGTHAEHERLVGLVREAEAAAGRPIALIADLQGPKLRIADIDSPRTVTRGETCVVAGEAAAQEGDIPVAPSVIGSVL
jgi:pyruvate kinase